MLITYCLTFIVIQLHLYCGLLTLGKKYEGRKWQFLTFWVKKCQSFTQREVGLFIYFSSCLTLNLHCKNCGVKLTPPGVNTGPISIVLI